MDLFIELESAEVLLELKLLSVVSDTIELEVKNIGRILDPVLVDADLVGAGFIVASDLSATDIFPVVEKTPVLDVEDYWAHFLDVLAYELFLACLFVI